MAQHGLGGVKRNLPEPVVILADGNPPTHPAPLSTLQTANTLICTDGAGEKAKMLDRHPDFIIGDMDSHNKASLSHGTDIIELTDQNSTDLEKALDFCIQEGVVSATLLGLSGGREDHMLANFAILSGVSEKMKLSAVTDYHTVHPVSDKEDFSCISNSTVSLLTAHGQPTVTTTGLRFPLQDQCLLSSGHGVSNFAETDKFSVKVAGGIVLVFIRHGD
jgi:thiamine pyrophosphokinase|tara:strand:- start:661 stop:1317 length:657 start_codon:yes stop_codon:yes gene_type:complete